MIERHRPRQRVDRSFGSCVRGNTLLRRECLHRRDINDDATAPLLHLGNREVSNQVNALDVRVEDFVPRCFVGIDHRSIALNAGAVDQDVHAAEVLHGERDDLLRIRRFADVGRDPCHRQTDMLEFGNRCLDRIVTPAANHDRRAAGR